MIVDDTQIELVGRWNFHIDPVIPNPFHSFHATNHTGDFAALNFTGTAVEIFGLKDPLGARYNITLDGVTTPLDAQAATRVQSSLFQQSNLDPNIVHTLHMTNDQEGFLFTLDIVNITSSDLPVTPSPSPTPTPTPAPSGASSSPRFSTGTLIAIALAAAILGVLLLFLLVLVCWRRRRAKRRKEQNAALPRFQTLTLPNLRNSGLAPLADTHEWMPDVYNPGVTRVKSTDRLALYPVVEEAPVDRGAGGRRSSTDDDDDDRPPRRRWERERATTPAASPLRSHTNSIFFASNPNRGVGGTATPTPGSPMRMAGSPQPPSAYRDRSLTPRPSEETDEESSFGNDYSRSSRDYAQ